MFKNIVKNVKEYTETVRKNDPALRGSLEILLYPSTWALLFYRVSHMLYNRRLYFLARLISQIGRLYTGIEIHPGAKIGKNLFIDHGAGVVIGETAEIGDNVLIYQGVTLGGTGKDKGKRHPTVGNNVMIGAGVKVLGPFKIGDNARIGAGSVVLAEVPANSTAVGVPARVVMFNGEKVRPDKLEHARFVDPVSTELCHLRLRIEKLEEKNQ